MGLGCEAGRVLTLRVVDVVLVVGGGRGRGALAALHDLDGWSF